MTTDELLRDPKVKEYIGEVLKGLPTGQYGKQTIAAELCDHILSSADELEKRGLSHDDAVSATLESMGSAKELHRYYRQSCGQGSIKQERYDGGSRKTDRRKWLRLLAPVGALLILGIVLAIKFIPRSGDYDLGVVFVGDSSVSPYEIPGEADTGEIMRVIENAVGDVDGDGEVDLAVQYIDGSGELTDSEGSGRVQIEDNYFKTLTVFAETQYVLYLCCPGMYKTYMESDFFDYAVPLKGSALFDSRLYGGWYACVIDWASVGKGDAAQTEAAYRAVEALMAAD